jgi:hypothetical protein
MEGPRLAPVRATARTILSAIARALDPRRLAAALTGSRLARALLAAAILAAQLGAVTAAGKSWLKRPFNNLPAHPPAFPVGKAAPTTDELRNDTRLLVSRWDSGHYIATALRGFTACPKQDLKGKPLVWIGELCGFRFYPTYSFLGRGLAAATGLAVDWALFAVAVTASFALLYLWTGPAVVTALGPGRTLLSLGLFAAFPSAFYLVSLHAESLTILFGLASFVALRGRHYLVGALLAGAATGVHFRATGFGVAYGAALLASFWFDRPRGGRALAARLAGLPLAGWGGASLAGYYLWTYNDPLLYFHSGYASRWVPRGYDGTLAYEVYSSMKPPYAGPVLLVVLVVAAIGARETLRRFAPVERVFLAIAAAFLVLVPLATRAGDYMGMQRYLLSVFPLFFAVASALFRHPGALALWLGASAAHYWHVELCIYLSYTTEYSCPCWKY